MGKLLFEVKNVSFGYESNRVLEGVHASVESGDFVAIIGPNGSAKTTFLKIIIALLRPQKGSILFKGDPISQKRLAGEVGYVGQKATSFNARFPLTVEELLYASLPKQGWFNNNKETPIIEHALRKVEMLPYRKRLLGELSGGQQQRVFLARALLMEPDVLVLDEPTTGLDAQGSQSLYELLSHFQMDHGMTIIMISHDVSEMVQRASRLWVMGQRKIVFEGNPGEWVRSEQAQLTSPFLAWIDVCNHCPTPESVLK